MKRYRIGCKTLTLIFAVCASISAARAQDDTAPTGPTVPVRMTVTASALGDRPVPEVKREDVTVRQRRNRMQVTKWQAARGDAAGLDLFLLIDDSSDTSLGSQLNDLRAFINAQPPSTSIGVGYMRNATVQILQNFTSDHSLAANAIRLPTGNAGGFGSPYLSANNLMNRWPQHANRRVLVMVTDGIDRARGGPRNRGLNTIPDATTTATIAQRTGTIIYAIYTPGVGHLRRNFWEATNGQNAISRLSEQTGGEAFFLGLQAPVSFRPFLDRLQNAIDNQYLLEFRSPPNRRAGLQSFSIDTETQGVELISADSGWVPATAQEQ
jgi:VWFA-related protein